MATSSSIELECVFFSTTPHSGTRSSISWAFTSSSRASSLIRIFLIDKANLLLTCEGAPNDRYRRCPLGPFLRTVWEWGSPRLLSYQTVPPSHSPPPAPLPPAPLPPVPHPALQAPPDCPGRPAFPFPFP